MKPVIFFGWEFLPAGSFRANILCFCWGSRGAECCAWLYFSHFTGTGWSSVSSVSAVSSMYRPLSLSHLRERDNEEFMGDDKVKGLSEARRERETKWDGPTCWPGCWWFCSKCTFSSWLRPKTADLSSHFRDLRFIKLLNPQRDRVSVQHPLVITMKNTG